MDVFYYLYILCESKLEMLPTKYNKENKCYKQIEQMLWNVTNKVQQIEQMLWNVTSEIQNKLAQFDEKNATWSKLKNATYLK